MLLLAICAFFYGSPLVITGYGHSFQNHGRYASISMGTLHDPIATVALPPCTLSDKLTPRGRTRRHMPKNLIVLPRARPDLDGVACAVAYAELLRTQGLSSLAWYLGEPDAEARYLISTCNDVVYASSEEVREASEFILVDASGLEGFPKFIAPHLVVEVIDHRFHHDPANVFISAKVQIERVGSAATLIVEKFINIGQLPSHSSACMLYGAIHSNTQCLRGSVTVTRDRRASAWLEDHSQIPAGLLDRQFAAREQDILANVHLAMARESKTYVHDGRSFTIAQLEFKGAERKFYAAEDLFYQALTDLGIQVMLNLVDVETARSILIVPSQPLRVFVAERTELVFNNDRAISDPVILRKQILDSLKSHKWEKRNERKG
jgi:nanoRNase/pAp phosphatase (c-di-AMP/oligoRNAs hydrolase)